MKFWCCSPSTPRVELSFGGLAELRELETGAALPVDAGQIREEPMPSEVGKFLEEIRRGCLGAWPIII